MKDANAHFQKIDSDFHTSVTPINDADLDILIEHYTMLRDLFAMRYRPEYVLVENDIRNKLYTLEGWKRSRAESKSHRCF